MSKIVQMLNSTRSHPARSVPGNHTTGTHPPVLDAASIRQRSTTHSGWCDSSMGSNVERTEGADSGLSPLNAASVDRCNHETPSQCITRFGTFDVSRFKSNVDFQEFIQQHELEHTNATSLQQKARIAHESIREILQRGGRFVRQVDSGEKAEEMEEHEDAAVKTPVQVLRSDQSHRNPMNDDKVEFVVRAEEDLFLFVNERSLKRVTAGSEYHCCMRKTQPFLSLFRHYPKYHGLCQDDLEYCFENVLENQDTPGSVGLKRGDTIVVRTGKLLPALYWALYLLRLVSSFK
jgi:hypothetical protein